MVKFLEDDLLPAKKRAVETPPTLETIIGTAPGKPPKNNEALIRLRVLRGCLENLKMNGKAGILKQIDAILEVLQ